MGLKLKREEAGGLGRSEVVVQVLVTAGGRLVRGREGTSVKKMSGWQEVRLCQTQRVQS